MDFSTVLVPRAEKPVPSDPRATSPTGRQCLELSSAESTAMGLSHTKQLIIAPPSSSGLFFVSFLDGMRNCWRHFWQSTCPHPLAMTAAEAFESTFRHDGQLLRFSLVVSSISSENSMVMSL